jgi:hypothetical protein
MLPQNGKQQQTGILSQLGLPHTMGAWPGFFQGERELSYNVVLAKGHTVL